jgi:hypothetical protein
MGLGDDDGDFFDSSSEEDDADNASGTKDFDTLLMLAIIDTNFLRFVRNQSMSIEGMTTKSGRVRAKSLALLG